jgi:hypothetical protein
MDVQIARNGEVIGTLRLDEIQAAIAGGTVLPSDYGWHEGHTDWTPISQLLAPSTPESTLPLSPKSAEGKRSKQSKKEKHDWRQDAPTEKQINYLKSFGAVIPESLTKGEASDLIEKCLNDPAALKVQEEKRDAAWKEAMENQERERQKRAEHAAYFLHKDVEDRKTEIAKLEQNRGERADFRRATEAKIKRLEEDLKSAPPEAISDINRCIIDSEVALAKFNEGPEYDGEDLKYLRDELKEYQRTRLRFWKATFKADWLDIDDDDIDDLLDYGSTIDHYHEEYGQFFKMPTNRQISEVLDGLDNSSSDWEYAQPEAFYAILNRNYPDQMRVIRPNGKAAGAKTRVSKGKGCLLLLPFLCCLFYCLAKIAFVHL